MDKMFYEAEKEMFVLHNPYVGTEHFFLSYLKIYGSNVISYDEFKDYVREIIGYSYKMSEYVLYTPILRYVKNNIRDVKDSIKYILSNEDSIAYNILKVKNVDCEEIMKELESV